LENIKVTPKDLFQSWRWVQMAVLLSTIAFADIRTEIAILCR
jgi:hypothetical protein